MNGDADVWTARNLWTGFLDGNSREFATQRDLSRKQTNYGRLDKYLIFCHFRLSVGSGTSSLMTPDYRDIIGRESTSKNQIVGDAKRLIVDEPESQG